MMLSANLLQQEKKPRMLDALPMVYQVLTRRTRPFSTPGSKVQLKQDTHLSHQSAGPALYFSVADLNSSCCCRKSSSSVSPLCSILLVFFSRVCNFDQNPPLGTISYNEVQSKLTFCCSLYSSTTTNTSSTYSPNPSSFNAFSMCSQAIVFLASFSAISFASDDIKVMNSTQHSIKRSRASLANVWPDEAGRISVMIFCTVAARSPL